MKYITLTAIFILFAIALFLGIIGGGCLYLLDSIFKLVDIIDGV